MKFFLKHFFLGFLWFFIFSLNWPSQNYFFLWLHDLSWVQACEKQVVYWTKKVRQELVERRVFWEPVDS